MDDHVTRYSTSSPWTASSSQSWFDSGTVPPKPRMSSKPPSPFECIITTHPPIFESLVLQLPTSSILDLYHTSRHLQTFLQDYPTAWNNLSFRSSIPERLASRQTSPASDGSGDSTNPQSKHYALDQLLTNVILPFGTRLRSLELDHTAVAGHLLITHVLHGRRETLQHLSVRGCKQVSLKYHIVPFLNIFNLQGRPRRSSSTHAPKCPTGLALKSLYTFRCRHHRRRPYTPASLLRRDSDSLPTDDLIRICHTLGIWIDSAWCPTPGGRCMRRKDYSVGRGTPDARLEVWVVFDRLWRSGNRLGSSTDVEQDEANRARGQLWEDAEFGYNGEPLGCEPRPGKGEGKLLSSHLRQSHKKFVEAIKCHDCGIQIHERCEHCSIRMHCMGCRKTMCASCAFARSLPKTSRGDENPGQFWWAPGQARKPELMLQEISPTSISDPNGFPNSAITPPVNMQWCCLKPMFSNGGSITFVGPAVTAPATNHIRTSPLPKGAGYEDPEFARLKSANDPTISPDDRPDPFLDGYVPKEGGKQILDWIINGPGSQDGNGCPRSLCQECWETPGWRAACKFCKEPFCVAHDLRGLSVRICGYKDLTTEKTLLEENMEFNIAMETWKKKLVAQDCAPSESTRGFRGVALENLHALIATVPDRVWQNQAEKEIRRSILDSFRNGFPGCPMGKDSALLSLDSEKASVISDASKSETTEDADIKSEPEHLWRGCRYLMCPKHRSVGDHRPKCTAAARQCTLCDTHICPECLDEYPACECSYCKEHYTCPNCFTKVESQCKKVEEEKEKSRKAEEVERKILLAARKLREADEAVERAGQFLAVLFGDTDAEHEVGAVGNGTRDNEPGPDDIMSSPTDRMDTNEEV